MPALYLALTVAGMFIEMGHGFAHRFDPLTVCTYDVDVEDVIDLRVESGRNRSGVGLADLGCAWLDDAKQGREPASWRIARALIAQGKAGVLVPSFATGATPEMHNLVLWKWSASLPYRVEVHDPSGRLPKNQLSWPE